MLSKAPGMRRSSTPNKTKRFLDRETDAQRRPIVGVLFELNSKYTIFWDLVAPHLRNILIVVRYILWMRKYGFPFPRIYSAPLYLTCT